MKILHEISFTMNRKESGFDKANDSAREYALMVLGSDEDGYLEKVPEWNRSTDFIEITFVSMCLTGDMCGWNYSYNFTCKVCRNNEDEET